MAHSWTKWEVGFALVICAIMGTLPAMGQAFCENPKVRKLTFTGSTEVGRILLRQASEQVMKVSMELGGNAPVIVFDDADLDLAAAAQDEATVPLDSAKHTELGRIVSAKKALEDLRWRYVEGPGSPPPAASDATDGP